MVSQICVLCENGGNWMFSVHISKTYSPNFPPTTVWRKYLAYLTITFKVSGYSVRIFILTYSNWPSYFYFCHCRRSPNGNKMAINNSWQYVFFNNKDNFCFGEYPCWLLCDFEAFSGQKLVSVFHSLLLLFV